MSSSASSSVTPTSSTPVSSIDVDYEIYPLWKYVTRTSKVGIGGNVPWTCNLCQVVKKSSYTRVRAHLLKISGEGIAKCPRVLPGQLVEMQKLDYEASEKMRRNATKSVPLPPIATSSTSFVSRGPFTQEGLQSGGKKRRADGSMGAIEKAFNMEFREHLHSEIARMFYSGGLPFNLARNPHYVNAFTYAASHQMMGYIPPGYNMLRTTLLQREKENVERLLAPVKASWREKGVTIVSDGWSDSQRRPLINFLAVTDGGPLFLKAVDCSGEIKDKHFIANLMKDVINEVRHENVVQIITDNAANCKGAGALIESQFPNIFWTPCVVHTLNLAMKNICAPRFAENNMTTYDQCCWISDIGGDVMQVKNYIMNHSMRLAIFNEYVPLKLLAVAETRFASTIVMLKRFKLIKEGLRSMVVSEKWTTYKEVEVEKANFVRDKILDDYWWDQIDYILSFTRPIYDMIRICDTDKACLHSIYDMWDSMIEQVKAAIFQHEHIPLSGNSDFYNVVHKILVDRWNKNNTPLHCLAHSLNPKYYTEDWLKGGNNRVPPQRDDEIAAERIKCLKRYFPTIEERTKVNIEFANFSGCLGTFSEFDSMHDRSHMEPKQWWLVYGASAPLLQGVAFKLLMQPASSSCAERNWSVYNFLHSLLRNKMATKRAEDLVFVHSNLRLLSRRNDSYMRGQTRMWDIAGDQFGSIDDVGILEVAQLSLDEPDMEAAIFFDNDEPTGSDVEMIRPTATPQ